MTRRLLTLTIGMVALAPVVVRAQSRPGLFDTDVHVAAARSNQFDDATDLGFGGRLSWRLAPLVGVEAEMNLFPGGFPDRPSFSRSRWEGLFGATVGPSLNRWRPFARVRPGFVSFLAADEPFICIAIFPPPLPCALASGRTVFALDVGGGVEVHTTRRTFMRVDVGDRMLRFEGPVFTSNRRIREDVFYSHGFRLTAGGGWRF